MAIFCFEIEKKDHKKSHPLISLDFSDFLLFCISKATGHEKQERLKLAYSSKSAKRHNQAKSGFQ